MITCDNVTQEPRRLAEPLAPAKRTRKIVLAEDEMAIREFMAGALREMGYTVVATPNGQEALRLFWGSHDDKIDLLVTDIVMPVMGGKELAYHVSRLSPETKIVFSSAYPEKLAQRNEMIDKKIPFLQKPTTASALIQMVQELLTEPDTSIPDESAVSDVD